MAQVAKRGCGVFIVGDIQKPAEHSPWQSAIAGPTQVGKCWTRWPQEVPFKLNNSVFL